MSRMVSLWGCILLFLACGDDDLSGYRLGEYFDCHDSQDWSVLEIRDELEGTWRWEYIDCFWTPEQANGREFEGYTVEFKEDSRLIIRDRGEVEDEASWQVILSGIDSYEIQTEPFVDIVFGRIYICDDQLLFNDSYLDGCDNFYKRK